MRVTVQVARIESELEPAGVTLRHAPLLGRREAPPAERLGEALREQPDVVHVHQVDDAAIVTALRSRAPVVMSSHGFIACTAGVHYFRPGQECTRAHGPACVPQLLLRGCGHTFRLGGLPAKYRAAEAGLRALREADLTVSYSHVMDRHLQVNRVQRRAIVPYFPTLHVEPPPPGAPDRRRILFAGRVVTPKGIGVLIRAMRGLDAELVVCGDGWQLEAMQRLASRLGVAERVEFKGWLGPDELAGELAAASLVAVPSVWPEPFGIVGIEGFAAGRPAVGTRTGGIGDWLEHGVNGLSVPAGDPAALARALGELLEDPAERDRLGQAGRRTVAERFSPERHLAALRAAYGAARATWLERRASETPGAGADIGPIPAEVAR